MADDDPRFTHTLPSGRADGRPVEEDDKRPIEPGDFVGRFRVRERIGEGGMGVVFAAEDPELGRVVAIKLLRPVQGSESEQQQKRMLREAQALARVSHRNLVMVFDVGSIRGRVWIAMEYVAGVTLETWLAAEHRTCGEIVQVFCEAARGLAAVHAVGLVHRDFKPGNVLVRADGTVQVLDFGLATQAGDDVVPQQDGRARPDLDALAATLTTTGAFMGTPAYMAPEQFLFQPTDGRSDQFSVCVALYEAIYGHRPFKGGDLPALMAATLEGLPGLPPELPGVPLGVRQALARGLSREPAARFPDMNALIEALERTRAPLPEPRSGGWSRFALGMIAGGGALAIGLAVWLSRQPADEDPAPVDAGMVGTTAAEPAAPPAAPPQPPATSGADGLPSVLELPPQRDEHDTDGDTDREPKDAPPADTGASPVGDRNALPKAEQDRDTDATSPKLPGLADLDEPTRPAEGSTGEPPPAPTTAAPTPSTPPSTTAAEAPSEPPPTPAPAGTPEPR
ncbi:MAG: serine/threonine protein kinase [Deltaproteobacteria bacterium]|nr:serine/threonine protein kinase [Deltaproteobacteria bacterium]